MSKHIEADVPSILKRDGVEKNDLFDCNNEIVNVKEIIKENGKSSWSIKNIICC